jgi:hypothetical protein
MSCDIRRIVIGCAAHQVMARRDVSENITHPLSPKSPSNGSASSRLHARDKMWINLLNWTWRDGSKGRAVNGLSGFAPMVYFHFFCGSTKFLSFLTGHHFVHYRHLYSFSIPSHALHRPR